MVSQRNREKGCRPFLKWAGGKYRLLHRIAPLLPQGERLVEPFAGSAAVWLNSRHEAALICDRNADLIALYRCLQREGEAFIDFCGQFFTKESNCRDTYELLRGEFNATSDEVRKAALFLYLNRHGFNGLIRYNGKGRFNVPFGTHKTPYFPRAEMRAFYTRTVECDTVFLAGDFRDCFGLIREGDAVYCDPPYLPHSPTANFTAYAGSFGLAEHEALARLAAHTAGNGIPVLLSNHDTALSRRLYAGAYLEAFSVQRHISCKGGERRAVPELLALFERRTPDCL